MALIEVRLLLFNECSNWLVGKEIYHIMGTCAVMRSMDNSKLRSWTVAGVQRDLIGVTFVYTDGTTQRFAHGAWGSCGLLPWISRNEQEPSEQKKDEFLSIELTLVKFDDLQHCIGKGVFLLKGLPTFRQLVNISAADAPRQNWITNIEFIDDGNGRWARLLYNGRSYEITKAKYNSDCSAFRVYVADPLRIKVPEENKMANTLDEVKVTLACFNDLEKLVGKSVFVLEGRPDHKRVLTVANMPKQKLVHDIEFKRIYCLDPLVMNVPPDFVGEGVAAGKHPMGISLQELVGKPPVKEKKMITQETLKSIANLFVEGVRIHSSAEAANKIVEIVKKQLGEGYPKFFATDLGKAIEPALVPVLVYMAASYFEGNEMAKKVRNIASYAIMGSAAGLTDYAAKLLPLFNEIAALSPLLDSTPEYNKHNCKG